MAKKTEQKWIDTKYGWFEQNPPDRDGYWNCYLAISPYCKKRVNRRNINLEHVRSRARYPEFKYDIDNLRPACSPCNKLKGSRDLEEIDMV